MPLFISSIFSQSFRQVLKVNVDFYSLDNLWFDDNNSSDISKE